MQSNPSNPAFNMGELKATFGPNQANAKIILYVMPVFILVGFIIISRIPVGGIVMLLIAGGLFWGYRAQLRARAEVYEKGVATTDWLGRRQSFQWQDVAGVYEFIGYNQQTWRPTQWVYTVHLKDGRRVKFDMAYEKIRNLGILLLAETGKNFLPQSLELLKAGKTVSFGEQIGINSQGFISGGQTLAWDQVDGIKIGKDGDLTIRKVDQRLPWKLIMHPRIANFPTFRAILHQAVKGTHAELVIDDPAFERAQELNQPRPVANIGTVSAAVGYDVRDLLMEGYTMEEIQRVVTKEITLAELRQAGPKSKRK